MAFSAYTSKGTGTVNEAPTTDFMLDSSADVANLPVPPKVNPGSTAIDPQTGDVYVLNASGVWLLFGGGAPQESGGTSDGDDDLQLPDEDAVSG